MNMLSLQNQRKRATSPTSTLAFLSGSQIQAAILASARILASILSTVNSSLRNTRTFLSNHASYNLSASFSDYVVIDYVTVPAQKRAAGREDSVKTLHKDEPEIGVTVFKHKEHRTRDDEWFWAEWP